jgi:hypothetical protein
MKIQSNRIIAAIVLALALQTSWAADKPKTQAAAHKMSPGAEMVGRLSKAKLAPEVIVTFVKHTTLSCSVTADDIIVLHQQGVPNEVVTALIEVGGAQKKAAVAVAAPAPSVTPAPSLYPPTVAYPTAQPTVAPATTVVVGFDAPVYYDDYWYPYYGPYYGYPGYVGSYGGWGWGGRMGRWTKRISQLWRTWWFGWI